MCFPFINYSFVEHATWYHNTQTLFSLFPQQKPKRKKNNVVNHVRALIMVVLFVIHRPAAPAVARPPSPTVAPSSAAPSSLKAPIPLHGAAPDVSDLGWKGRRRWRKGDCERLHVDIGHPAVGGRGRTLSESTTGDVS